MTSASKISPSDLVPDSSLTVGIAFDNFDWYVETLSSKDTLHDTVGIIYQSIKETSEALAVASSGSESQPFTSGNSTNNRKKRRRTFESYGLDIEPYYKKPKMSSIELFPLACTDRQKIPENYEFAKIEDLLWMIQFSILPKSTSMWVGRNAQYLKDKEVTFVIVTYSSLSF